MTPGYRLVALDAKTGQPVEGFGEHGIVDLKQDFDQVIRPDLVTGEVGLHAAPTVAGNIVLVGAAFREGFTPSTYRNNKGYARAYDARTGKHLCSSNAFQNGALRVEVATEITRGLSVRFAFR